MILLHNAAGGQIGSCTPWDLARQDQCLRTVGHIELDTNWEVKMTFGNDSGYFTEYCDNRSSDEIYWTTSASGGCWPFAAMARNPNRSLETPLSALAFAHTADKRHEETWLFGRIFGTEYKITDPAQVYLVVMLQSVQLSDAEIGIIQNQAFKTFEDGFGHELPADNKIILGTTTVNAAMTRFGDFGELSNDQAAILADDGRLPACARL